MGKKGKEIVRTDVNEVIRDLTTAYADEWLAHYQYWVTARLVRGLDADLLRSVLDKQSMDELGHAQKLAERIIQLGGKPVTDPAILKEKGGCGYTQPPEERSNLKQVIEDVLASEACAIEFYSKMVDKYRMTDVVTHEIFEDLLKDEIEDEEEWENFKD